MQTSFVKRGVAMAVAGLSVVFGVLATPVPASAASSSSAGPQPAAIGTPTVPSAVPTAAPQPGPTPVCWQRVDCKTFCQNPG